MTSPLVFDAAAEERRIISFIRRTVKAAGARGVVLGLSGGVDSAVVAGLCARALGKERVLVVILPSGSTPVADTEDARGLARSLGVQAKVVDIGGSVNDIIAKAGLEGSKLARANLQARVRMLVLYFFANSMGRLVAGTGDRSEILIGFYTKYGDGGVDFLPIAHLFKTQVRELGAQLGLPRNIVAKPSSPQLWPGHRATDEIPADYDKLDLVLHHVFDRRASARTAAAKAGVERSVVDEVLDMHRRSEHKRSLPPGLKGLAGQS